MELTPINLTWEKSPLFIILILTCFYYSSPAQEAPNAWINEVHYDNVGDDAQEGIEIVVEADNFPNFDISLMRITLYNGNGGGSYKDLSMADAQLDNNIPPFTIYSIEIPNIQNGDPDGIALSYNNQLIQFLSYGGTLTAIDGIAEGTTSEDIEVRESSATPTGYSLQLGGSGDRYKAFNWNEAAPETFGSENNGQSLVVINGPQPVTNFNFDRIAPDKVAISWEKPIGVYDEDWSGVLVFASDKGPNEVDLEGKDYTDFAGGDQIFGKGTKTINGYAVVRKEANQDGVYVITELELEKNYHFIAYTYLNIPGTDNDLFSTSSEEIEVSTKVEDIADLQAIPLRNKARLSWKNPLRAQQHDWWHETLVVASENPVNFTPDQKTFSADNIFGEGDSPSTGEFVVYQGKDSLTFVNELENGKGYYFKTFVRYDAADKFYWSQGVETRCEPFNNIKTWTGNAGNNMFTDANNWQPTGVPESSHDVILDDTHVGSAYEVQYVGASDLEINSITILPQNVSSTITLKLKSVEDSKIKLTLHDDISPLTVSNYGVLINEMASLNEAIQTPNGKIILGKEAKYTHNTRSRHTSILNNIALEDETIPGTIEFDIPGSAVFALSISGRSFSSMVFSSENPITFNAFGSSPITIKEALVINEKVNLNLNNFSAPLIVEGDLRIDGELLFNNGIHLIGDKIQTISRQHANPIALENLTINKSDNNVLLDSDLAIKKKLEFVNGIIETGENHLILDFAAQDELEFVGNGENIAGSLKVIRNVNEQEIAFVHAGITFREGTEDLGAVSVIRNTGTAIENGDSKSIKRTWTITSTSELNSPRPVEFKWNESDEEDFDAYNAQLWQESEDQTEWTALGEVHDGSSRSITATIDRFSRFTVTDIENPLPISLLFFEVKHLKNNAFLVWSTLEESNNEGFEIQKSVDQKSFYKIGFVTGNNTTSEKKLYEFVDEAHAVSAYYRLKQIDFDGTFSYSPIRFLSKTSPNSKFALSPNPVAFPISISNSNVDRQKTLDYCSLHSSLGTKMFEAHNHKIYILEKDINQIILNLNSGLYILTLSLNNQVQKIKIIKE